MFSRFARPPDVVMSAMKAPSLASMSSRRLPMPLKV